MGVACEWCTYLSYCTRVKAASRGKHLCGHWRVNTFGHNSECSHGGL